MSLKEEDFEIKPFDAFGVAITKKSRVDIEDALEETGFGRYNIILIIVCGLLLFAANAESYGIGFVVPAAECELGLDSYKKGILTSVNLAGITISCSVWGYISDIKGRRNLLMLNLITAFLTGIVAAVTPSFWGFCLLRFLNGICISGPTGITFVYLGEFLSTSAKPKSSAWVATFIALAMIYLPALGWVLLQHTFKLEFLGLHLNNWRVFMLVNSVHSAFAALGLMVLTESPKYLYHTGRLGEALRVLKEMYASNTGNSEDDFPVESLDEEIILDSSSKRGFWKQILPLFQPPLLTYTLAASFMQAVAFAIGSGLYAWYPDIISNISDGGNASLTVCDALSFNRTVDEDPIACDSVVNDSVFVLNIIIGLYYLVAYTLWYVIVKALGTRNFFVGCMGISAALTAALCYTSQKFLVDIMFITIFGLPGIAITVVNMWVVDIFPTHICGMAICITLTVGRFGSVVSSLVAGIMLEWNCPTTFMLYAVSLIACLLASFLLPQKK